MIYPKVLCVGSGRRFNALIDDDRTFQLGAVVLYMAAKSVGGEYIRSPKIIDPLGTI